MSQQRLLSGKCQKALHGRLHLRASRHHILCDAGQLPDTLRNLHAIINKCLVGSCDLSILNHYCTDFQNPVLRCAQPCRLKVERDICMLHIFSCQADIRNPLRYLIFPQAGPSLRYVITECCLIRFNCTEQKSVGSTCTCASPVSTSRFS